MQTYRDFIGSKANDDTPTGLDVVPDLNPMLFPFQRDIVTWALKRGRAALAVMLDGFEEIRSGSKKIASWTMKKGSVSISKPEGVESKGSVIDWMKKEKPSIYRMLEKNGMIKTGKSSRYVSVKWKDEEE